MLKTILVLSAFVVAAVAIMPRQKAFDFSAQAVMPDL